MHRRWRGWLTRRGRFTQVPPAPAATPPAWAPQWIDQTGWRPRWPRSLRRPRFADPPWPPIAPAAPAVPPDVLRQAGPARYAGKPRRGVFTPVVPGPAGPTPQPSRPRLRAGSSRRGRFASPPWPPIVQPPPAIPAVARQSTSSRPAVRPRRGLFTTVVPPQIAPLAPPFVPQFARSRRTTGYVRRSRFGAPQWTQPVPVPPARAPRPARALPVRRGRFLTVPPAQLTTTAPPFIPQTLRLELHPAPRRRGRLVEPPWSAIAPAVAPPAIPALTRARVRPVLRRPGRFIAPPWPQQAAPTPPAYIPTVARQALRASARVRRGQIFTAPPPQVVTAAPVYPPQTVRARLRPPLHRAGRFVQPPWPAAAPAAPAYVPAGTSPRRPAARLVRRGRFTPTPPATLTPPPRLTSRRPQPARPRRGRFVEPGWPFTPPAGPGPLAPAARSTRRRYGFPRRRTHFVDPPWFAYPPAIVTVGQGSTYPRPAGNTHLDGTTGGTTWRTSPGTTSPSGTRSATRPLAP